MSVASAARDYVDAVDLELGRLGRSAAENVSGLLGERRSALIAQLDAEGEKAPAAEPELNAEPGVTPGSVEDGVTDAPVAGKGKGK